MTKEAMQALISNPFLMVPILALAVILIVLLYVMAVARKDHSCQPEEKNRRLENCYTCAHGQQTDSACEHCQAIDSRHFSNWERR